MHKLRGTSTPQLSLIDQFDKYSRRDSKLVDELILAIKNFKYFRINTEYAQINKKKEIQDNLNQILYWTAFLAWKKARFVEEYKDNWKLEAFLDITKDKGYLVVTEVLSQDTLSQYYQNGHRRLKTTFMAYKDLLKDEKAITVRILDNFNNIHDLTHAV